MDEYPENLYEQLCTTDLIHKLKLLLGEWHVGLESKRFEMNMPSVQTVEPWVHVKKAGNRHCTLWFNMAVKCGVVHPGCGEKCWKTVVRPRTIKELFALHDIQTRLSADRGFPCKCGIERRLHVHGLYGGYFYADSLEDGQMQYKIVREAVDADISPDVSVILKQGCTEIEMLRGAGYKLTEEDRHWSAMADKWFVFPDAKPEQPGIVKIHTMRAWLEFAWQNGDETARDYNEGEAYTLPLKTYHQED
ncbi:MAG: hypothetical protein DRP56_07105 [Planctomycetota bacterium]|nr:MAG: hypothetical protein DRP56_07105 [Planctomycetota bacterium]